MADLLSSDPDTDVETFSISERGSGYLFGEKDVNKFNHINNIELIARAHQLIQEGYQFLFHNQLVFDEHMNRSFKIFEECPEYERNTQVKRPIPEYFL